MGSLDKYLEPYHMSVTTETIILAISCRLTELQQLVESVHDLDTKQTLQLVITELQEVQKLLRQIL
jgi:hypothetical protein